MTERVACSECGQFTEYDGFGETLCSDCENFEDAYDINPDALYVVEDFNVTCSVEVDENDKTVTLSQVDGDEFETTVDAEKFDQRLKDGKLTEKGGQYA